MENRAFQTASTPDLLPPTEVVAEAAVIRPPFPVAEASTPVWSLEEEAAFFAGARSVFPPRPLTTPSFNRVGNAPRASS